MELEFEQIDPKHTALFVIDPQYDLCMEYLPNGEKTPLAKMSDAAGIDPPAYDFSLYPGVLTKLQPLLKAARSAGVMVVYTKATRLPQTLTSWRKKHLARIYRVEGLNIPIPNFAVEGTPGHEFVEEIKPQTGDVVIKKSRQSAFVGTPTYLVLKNNGIKSIVLTGCQTEGCIESTLRDAAYSYDYQVYPVEDCIASFNVEMHEAMMKVIKGRCHYVQSEELIQLWNP